MKLFLKNFRHHREKEFSFPDNGLELISGHNGSGKTTVLQSISYALFGKAKGMHSPYSYGTETCSVTMEYNGMVIKRSSRPNRLVLQYDGGEYEDSAAQGVIENVLGMNYNEFLSSVYIPQGNKGSLISMTPTEQFNFIEKMALPGDSHSEYRARIKKKITEYKEKLISLNSTAELLKEQVEEFIVEVVPDDPDIKGLEEDMIDKENEFLRKDNEKSKKLLISLKNSRKELDDYNEKNQKYVLARENNVARLDSLQKRIDEMVDENGDEVISELEEEVERLEGELSDYENYKKFTKESKKYKDMMDVYTKNIQKKIVELEKEFKLKSKTIDSLRKEYESITREKFTSNDAPKRRTDKEIEKDFQSILALFREKFNCKRLNRVKKAESLLKCAEIFREETVKNIQTAKASNGTVYKCPSCEKKIAFVDHVLSCVSDDSGESMDLGELENNLRVIEENMSRLEEVIKEKKMKPRKDFDENRFNELKETIDSFDRLASDIERCNEQLNTIPDHISLLKTGVDRYQSFLPNGYTPPNDIQKLSDKCSSLKEKLRNKKLSEGSINKLNREKSVLEEKIETIDIAIGKIKSPKMKNRKDIDKKIDLVEQRMADNTERLIRNKDLLVRLNNLQQVLEKNKKKDSLQEKYKSMVKDIEMFETKLKSLIRLDELCKKAEIAVMETKINDINEAARVYLDKLFAEPIEVTLETDRIDSKGNYQQRINTLVKHRGNTPSINEMSGGELQKCQLAFLLGVNDIINGKLIMLDECINSVTSEDQDDILRTLRSLSKDKLVIVILHQATKGVFDNVSVLE